MRRACTLALLTIVGSLFTSFAASASEASTPVPMLDQTTALRDSQAALGRTLDDYTLLDREGQPVRLASYRGKPLLVNFIYSGCFQVCPATTRVLQEAVTAAQNQLGVDQFNVISIGFNQPVDSPQALKSYTAQHGINRPNWEFLSPNAAIVPALAHDFGFSYVPTPAGFDHILQVSIVDGRGRIYQQVYGDSYTPQGLIEPLRQLITGTLREDTTNISALVDRVRILCSVYDPATGQYRVSYGLALEVAGGITFLILMGWFLIAEWWQRGAARRRVGT